MRNRQSTTFAMVPFRPAPGRRGAGPRHAIRLLAILALTATAIAQQGTKDLSEASLEELTNIQVYSASKHMQSASEAPASVTVVTADEIQKYGYRTLADILQSVRGFYTTYDRLYSYVGVRGFGRLGDWNSRILLLVDGHRINNNADGRGMLGTEFPVDVDLIERVEIIRGPSSSLYGADAFFAVINVITRKAPQLKGLELSFAPASFGTYEGRASYGGRYRGLEMLLSGTFYDSQGQTFFFPQFDKPATNYGITRNTDYESSQHILATISFHGFTLQGLFSQRDKGVPTAYFGSLFNDPRTKSFDYQQYFDLTYQHSIGEKWYWTARTSYDQAREQDPVAYSTGLPDGSTTVDTYSFRGNWWNSEMKLSRTLLEKHKITVGTEITDNVRQDQGDYTSINQGFDLDPASSRIWAIYGQDEFAITYRLTLSAGLRYDRYSNFGGTTNPRLGLIYHLFQPTTLKLLYGTAFRAPEPSEIITGFGSFYEDNPGIKPETVRSVEGVVEQGVGAHFNLSGSVFQNWIEKLISLETDPNDSPQYQNSDRARATGAEIELAGQFAGGLKGTASYSYTNVVDLDAHQILANSPAHLAKLNVILPMVQQQLFASLGAQYTSSRQTLAGNTVSGFPIFNVTLLGHTLGKHLDLSASVYNLLDRKYFDPGRPEDVQDAIQQNGRSFRIKVTGRF
jgi:outer membrane receptor for ferrienterochelin and colicins